MVAKVEFYFFMSFISSVILSVNIINNTNLEFYCLFNGGLFVIMIL